MDSKDEKRLLDDLIMMIEAIGLLNEVTSDIDKRLLAVEQKLGIVTEEWDICGSPDYPPTNNLSNIGYKVNSGTAKT
jgi:hypothetical protein